MANSWRQLSWQILAAAEFSLREVLTAKPSLEVRQRVETLLSRLDGTEPLRQARVLEVLENIGSPETERVLASLAQGATQARLTRAAQEALSRLNRREPGSK